MLLLSASRELLAGVSADGRLRVWNVVRAALPRGLAASGEN